MSWPAIIILVMAAMQILVETHKDGQPYPRRCSCAGALINEGIILGLLYWGGFFAHA